MMEQGRGTVEEQEEEEPLFGKPGVNYMDVECYWEEEEEKDYEVWTVASDSLAEGEPVAILDTGSQGTLAGSTWVDWYVGEIGKVNGWRGFVPKERRSRNRRYRFGRDVRGSEKEVCLPCCVGAVKELWVAVKIGRAHV